VHSQVVKELVFDLAQNNRTADGPRRTLSCRWANVALAVINAIIACLNASGTDSLWPPIWLGAKLRVSRSLSTQPIAVLMPIPNCLAA
jgi:hypothetical protein